MLSISLLLGIGKLHYVPKLSEKLSQSTPNSVDHPLAFGEPIDINQANQVVLQTLPGIGPATAIEIVRERQLFGDYQSIFELQRATGIGEHTVRQLSGFVVVIDALPLPKISLNTANKQQLMRLVGVGPVLAKRICEKRPFQTFEQVLNVRGVGPKTLEKWLDAGVNLSSFDAPL